MYTYVYIYLHIYTHMYIYIYMEGFEKFQYIPGTLSREVHTHAQYCAHAQERPQNVLTSLIWLKLMLCSLCK